MKGAKSLFMAEFQIRKNVLSVCKRHRISLLAARNGAKIEKVPPAAETIDIHAGGIRAFIVGIFVTKPCLEKKSELLFDNFFKRLLVHFFLRQLFFLQYTRF